MENQKLNDQLEAFRKLNKENYNNIRKQIFELKQAVDKNFNRSGSEGEAVKEKEYTILSFIGVDGRIRSLNESGNYRAKDFGLSYTLDSMLKGHDTLEDGSQQIHSVRRESDGEIFTLGYLDGPSMEPITSITVNEDYGGIALHGRKFTQGLSHAKKAPIRKPILITEDGVEIFEPKDASEGMVFSVRTDAFIEKRIWVKDAIGCGSLWKHFSTKEKAEEYIKWNKPMYSLRDVENATFGSVEVTEYLEKLGRK